MTDISGESTAHPRSVLVVDDEAALRAIVSRILTKAGFVVEAVDSAVEGLKRLATGTFDVVVTDIMMPQMDGVRFLREIRKNDLDLPVVMMTAAPSVSSAQNAVQLGAASYMRKPFSPEGLVEVVGQACRLGRISLLKREATALLRDAGMPSDLTGLDVVFSRALETCWVAYQPIVNVVDKTIIGYEALLRSNESVLPDPGAILEAAARLNRQKDIAYTVARRVGPMVRDNPDLHLFLNLQPACFSVEVLRAIDDELGVEPSRVTLEVTERDSLPELLEGVAAGLDYVRSRGFRVAIDDLGAGYASLNSFVQLKPDVAKLDMILVRDIDKKPVQQSLVRSMRRVCEEMGIAIIAEGVETDLERSCLLELGCHLQQGFFFARPAPPLVEVSW